MIDNAIPNLLSQVKAINSRYAELAKLTGENFNVFSIMRIDRSEVNTHSAFLAELLNPKGCHDQGGVFLNIFIKYINSFNDELNLPDFDFDRTNTAVEKYIGEINSDQTKGGRIDIHCEDNDYLLMIENKIYAGDQPNQLRRYINYGLDKRPKKRFWLFYLTLEYKNIPEDVKESVIQITYKKHIIEWLELCKKETVDLPVLRETITQYINLIKRLTKQTINHRMSTELINMLNESVENFNAGKNISLEFKNAENEIYLTFWHLVAKEICEELGTDWKYELEKSGLFFYFKDCNLIGFEFDMLSDHVVFGISKNRFKNVNQFKRELYDQKIDLLASSIIPDDNILDWIGREQTEKFNIYESSNLGDFLPLKNNQKPANVKRVITKVTGAFKTYREENPAYEEYIINVVNQLNEIRSRLTDVKSIIKGEIEPTHIGIWEDCVLYIDCQIENNQVISLDIFLKNDHWVIEIFVRNSDNRQFIDSFLGLFTLFQDKNYERTARNGIIYDRIPFDSTDKLTETLIRIVKNLK